VTEQPRVGVLALQGDVREHLRALEASGARPVTVRRPAELDGVDALVIPGGESTTIDKLIGVFGLREPLLDRLAAGMPVYGSCAGMILLADRVVGRVVDGSAQPHGLGGIDMTVRRNAFGRQADSFEADLTVAGIIDSEREPVRGVFIRAPWVEKVGDGVEVLARLDDRIVAVRQGHLLATSFHPEITGDVRVHRLFVDLVEQHLGKEGS
jgi:5'-phosphate synthase pdxT subunit